jgi:iron complex transport system ATP-binding protein
VTAFSARAVTAIYPGRATPALSDLSIEIPRGQFFAVIGPNGSGKSTLIRTLLGALLPASGDVQYGGRAIASWPRRDFAREVGAVAQLEEMAFPITVRELVAMGRYPHLGALRNETSVDHQAIADAMQRCNITELADRPVASLSGGERQRARIARALAQQPSTLVLDEPTVALDISHEMAVFELLRSLTRNDGWTVVVATHHINLAARYADALVLLDRGRPVAAGTPNEVMRQDILQTTYGWPLLVYSHNGAGFDRGAPQVAPLSHTHGESQ